MSEKAFYSKILLFGEYSIIKHSMALSIPYSLFEGKLKFQRETQPQVDNELKALARYLKDLKNKNQLNFVFDVHAFDFDLGQGLYFDSSIPQGYGVGSSGALVASLFHRYGDAKLKDIAELKNIFSIIESHFHGSSSGIDPLISYLNKNILVRGNDELGTVSIPNFNEGKGGIFLLNTSRSRRTEPLVNLFLEKCKSKLYEDNIENVLVPINNNCISNFLEGLTDELYDSFEVLSKFQLDNFSPMIPNLYLDLWNKGLESRKFFLKLCGAGGGGFLLGITKNFDEAQELLGQHETRLLYKF
ncbi:MAG: mevalonate kinase [Halobacteriovoraceae bacterium]|jgi:mevalonate kinase|nr:mevalonate kinase [Halobacteriovoraceae bacterium]MBT5094335.1 mevalonate kinase [Halobacteriovoraceae bacterium]